MQNVWARVLVFYGTVGGIAWINWLVAREFDGITVALFLIVSLLLLAGLLSTTINPVVKNRESSTSDEIG